MYMYMCREAAAASKKAGETALHAVPLATPNPTIPRMGGDLDVSDGEAWNHWNARFRQPVSCGP
jgi:hypothetical protein